MLDLYLAHKAQGLNDTDAALAAAAKLRKMADVRSTFREAGADFSGQKYDVADRQQLMAEADRPLLDLAARRATGPLAAEEVGRQRDAVSGDIALRAQTGLLDPMHPTNVAARAAMTKLGLTPPPNLTVATIPKDLWDTLKPLAETEQKRRELAALAPGRAAEAEKNRAEAAKLGAMTPPEVAKTGAEAEKAAAEAAVERQKVGGQVAPGWQRSGTVANVSDKEIEEFRGQAGAAAETERITNELRALLGNKNMIMNPTKRADAAVLTGRLLGSLKSSMGIKGLPAQDVDFLEQLTGNLTKFSPGNVLGLTKNAERLKSLNANAKAELETRAKTLGLVKAGAAPAGDEHAKAVKWAQEHPKDPRAVKILEVASKASGAGDGGTVAGR